LRHDALARGAGLYIRRDTTIEYAIAKVDLSQSFTELGIRHSQARLHERPHGGAGEREGIDAGSRHLRLLSGRTTGTFSAGQ
jgi:hypothetical protein